MMFQFTKFTRLHFPLKTIWYTSSTSSLHPSSTPFTMCTYACTVFECKHSHWLRRVKRCAIGVDFEAGRLPFDCAIRRPHGLHSRKLPRKCTKCQVLHEKLARLKAQLADCARVLDRPQLGGRVKATRDEETLGEKLAQTKACLADCRAAYGRSLQELERDEGAEQLGEKMALFKKCLVKCCGNYEQRLHELETIVEDETPEETLAFLDLAKGVGLAPRPNAGHSSPGCEEGGLTSIAEEHALEGAEMDKDSDTVTNGESAMTDTPNTSVASFTKSAPEVPKLAQMAEKASSEAAGRRLKSFLPLTRTVPELCLPRGRLPVRAVSKLPTSRS